MKSKFWLILFCLFAPFTLANEQLLGQMLTAIAQENYQGRYYVQKGDTHSEYQIYHQWLNGEVNERIVPVGKTDIEIIRRGDILTCLSGEEFAFDQLAISGTPFSRLKQSALQNLAQQYDIQSIGMAAVLDYKTDIIAITSKDEWRYDYRLWLEAESRLLVKMQVLHDDMVLEEFGFSELTLTTDDTNSLEPASEYKHMEVQSLSEPLAMQPLEHFMPGWLPEGFSLSYAQEHDNDDGVHTCKFMYSDGLASFSVFINKRELGLTNYKEQQGSTLAMMKIMDNVVISLVGEIPETTANKIIDSIMMMEH